MRTNRATRRKAANKAAKTKSWLVQSTVLLPFACTPALLHAQEAAEAATGMAAAETSEPEPEVVIVTGTRATGIDTFTSSSPVQVLAAEEKIGRAHV